MRKSLWMLALTLCCLFALCLNASAEADPALEPGGTEAELIEKAADPLVIELEQPTAMVVDKQFNLVYTISGGTSPYDVYVEVTHNGRYVDSFDGNKRNYFTPEEAGSYTVSVTVTDAEGRQVAGRFTATAFGAGTLAIKKLTIAEGADGKSIVATAQIDLGVDNPEFTFELYDENDVLLDTIITHVNSCTFKDLEGGKYYVKVSITDGYSTVNATSSMLELGLNPNFYLEEKALNAYLSSDLKSIFIDRPTAKGGGGTYTYAYTCYNDASRPMNYFYSTDATVAMTPGSGGRYVVFCTVTDNASGESITLHTDWFSLPTANGPLTCDPNLTIRASATKREIVVTRPSISGGTGKYTVYYSCYDSQGRNVAFFSSQEASVSIHTGSNGHFNVTAIVTDTVEYAYSISDWIDLDGYDQRTPMTIGSATSSISGDNRSIYIDKPAITGGTGTYTVTYTCIDELGRVVAYFNSTSSRVAMTPGFNGRFIIRVTVTDGVETLSTDTGWNYISGYTAVPESADKQAAEVQSLLEGLMGLE